MNTVEPIKDFGLVLSIAEYLKEKSERNYVMFMIGIYSGLRISDILKLRVVDVKNKDHFYVREKKTGKENRIYINDELRPIIRRYIVNMQISDYLFTSRKGTNKPISRVQAYKILNRAAKKFGLESCGCHTTRKTFGFHLYQQTGKIGEIKRLLNHSNESTTMRYIGITDESKDNAIKKLSYKR
jgi:integrase